MAEGSAVAAEKMRRAAREGGLEDRAILLGELIELGQTSVEGRVVEDLEVLCGTMVRE